MLITLNKCTTCEGMATAYPYDIAGKSTDTLPADCPIMTTVFVVDKMDVVISDGEGNWYREADKPVAAGQPISALF